MSDRLSNRKNFLVKSPAGGFLTQAADYFDVPWSALMALDEGETSGQFFIMGTGDDDDVFNLWLP